MHDACIVKVLKKSEDCKILIDIHKSMIELLKSDVCKPSSATVLPETIPEDLTLIYKRFIEKVLDCQKKAISTSISIEKDKHILRDFPELADAPLYCLVYTMLLFVIDETVRTWGSTLDFCMSFLCVFTVCSFVYGMWHWESLAKKFLTFFREIERGEPHDLKAERDVVKLFGWFGNFLLISAVFVGLDFYFDWIYFECESPVAVKNLSLVFLLSMGILCPMMIIWSSMLFFYLKVSIKLWREFAQIVSGQ